MFYIVGTPIGNLQDLSTRQAKILSKADYILAEDTRTTAKLLIYIKNTQKYNINPDQQIISFYKDKEYEKSFKTINLLKQNKNICLVSESGMPLISDPGHFLLNQVIKNNITYSIIPGPTALITALISSGFVFKSFTFLEYLPKKESEIKKIINKIININKNLRNNIYIFYESPNRIENTLKILNELIPTSEICICREMTKKFEEIIRGKPKDLINRKYKGEITIVLSI